MNEVEIVCTKLYKYYDMNILNKYSPEIKNKFLAIMKLYKKNPEQFTKVNTTFINLLYNLNNPKKQPVYEYITGPSELTKLVSSKYKKTIYLFGENHSNIKGCENQINLIGKRHCKIEDFFNILFRTSPVFIDFFIEFPIMFGGYNSHLGNNCTLWDILEVMKECVGQYRNCPYNIRLHTSDVRHIIDAGYKHSFIKILEMFTKIKKIPIREFQIEYINEINTLSKIKTKKDINNLLKDQLKHSLIDKEINRSKLNIKKLFGLFCHTTITNETAQKIGICYTHFKYSSDWTLCVQDSGIFTMIFFPLMDIYTLARMFKVFNVKPGEYHPKEPRNIIYYAGTAHTRLMKTVLIELGFNVTLDIRSNIDSCLHIKQVVPLFN